MSTTSTWQISLYPDLRSLLDDIARHPGWDEWAWRPSTTLDIARMCMDIGLLAVLPPLEHGQISVDIWRMAEQSRTGQARHLIQIRCPAGTRDRLMRLLRRIREHQSMTILAWTTGLVELGLDILENAGISEGHRPPMDIYTDVRASLQAVRRTYVEPDGDVGGHLEAAASDDDPN